MKKISLFSRQLTYTQIFFAAVAVISLRVFLEWTLFVFPVEIGVYQDYARYYMENVYSYLNFLLIAVYFLARLSGTEHRVVSSAASRVFALILLAPVIDRLLGRTEAYLLYCRPEHLLRNLLTLSLAGDGTPGLVVEIHLAMLIAAAFVFSRTRSVLKAVCAAVFLKLLALVVITPELFTGWGMADASLDHFLALYYFIPFVLLSYLTLFLFSRERAVELCARLRSLRSAVFVFLAAGGALYVLQTAQRAYLVDCCLAGCAVFLVWEYGLLLGQKGYRLAAVLCAFLALSCAAVVNVVVLGLAALGLAIASVYTVPALMLRNSVPGYLLTGVAALVSFTAGVFSAIEPQRAYDLLSADKAVFFCSFLLIMGALVAACDGGRRSGGTPASKNGLLVRTILILLVFNIPNFFFQNAYVYVLSLIAAFAYLKFEGVAVVYISALAVVGLTLHGVLQIKDRSCSGCAGERGHRRRVVIDQIKKRMPATQAAPSGRTRKPSR